jgi:hypothetical protein
MIEITAIINIAPGQDAGVLALQGQVLGLLSYAQTRVIKSDEDVKLATDDLSLMSGLKKAIESKRKEYVDPINAHLKDINDKFKLISDPLAQADSMTRTKVLAYRAEVERIRKETEEINRKRLEAAQQEAALNNGEISEEIKVLDVPPPPPTHTRTEVGTLGTQMIRKWELVDFKLLPDEYKIPDASRIGKVVRAGIPSIPGVRIWEEPTLRITTNKGE